MSIKKIIAIALIAIVCVGFLFACDNEQPGDMPSDQIPTYEENGNEEDESGEMIGDHGFPIDPITGRVLPNVPDRDLDGYEFVILAHCTTFNIHWFSRDISAEELLGEPINDAVYHRNRAVEERFNITIRADYSNTPQADARTSINAGDRAHDVLTFNIMQTAVLAQEGMLLDLTRHVPYLNLEKPWWDQRANEHLSIANRLFFTVGDLLVIDNDSLLVFFVNNDVIQEYGMDNPYQMVRDGTWTVDRMWEMATSFSHDLDGSGQMGGHDAWGLLSFYGTFYGNVMSTGHFVANKDQNDIPTLNLLNPRIVASFDRWIEIMMDRNHTMYAGDFQHQHQPGLNIWDNQIMMLSQGRGLFMFSHMNRATLMRPLDFNFGILPNPKLDETQTEYFNYVHKNTSKGISIPVTADAEISGLVLEALAAESRYTLRPAYFEISLTYQMLRDRDSVEMMELIFETRAFDLAHLYNWGGVFSMVNGLANRRESNLISSYEAISDIAEAAMNNTIEIFLAMD